MKPSALALIPYLAMILGLHMLQSAWVAFAIYHGLIFLSLAAVKNRPLWKELLQGWDMKLGLGAVVFGLGGGVVLYLLAPLAEINQAMIDPVLGRLGLQGIWWFVFVLYHSLVNPWFEEILWRGKLGDGKKWPVVNDLLFAGYHLLVLVLFLDWIWLVLSIVLLTLAGWLWRLMRSHQKGLLLPVISHMAADTSIMVVIYYISR